MAALSGFVFVVAAAAGDFAWPPPNDVVCSRFQRASACTRRYCICKRAARGAQHRRRFLCAQAGSKLITFNCKLSSGICESSAGKHRRSLASLRPQLIEANAAPTTPFKPLHILESHFVAVAGEPDFVSSSKRGGGAVASAHMCTLFARHSHAIVTCTVAHYSRASLIIYRL